MSTWPVLWRASPPMLTSSLTRHALTAANVIRLATIKIATLPTAHAMVADPSPPLGQARLHAQRYRFSYQEPMPAEQANSESVMVGDSLCPVFVDALRVGID